MRKVLRNLFKKIESIVKNEKGDILQFIIILAVTAILAVTVLPPLSDALGNRMESTVESFNSTDTIIIE